MIGRLRTTLRRLRGEGAHGARRGGSLYPVLMITAILLILSSMLPQVLVGASNAQKNGVARDRLLDAVESGVAFAEARLKQQLSADLMAGSVPKGGSWVIKPSYDNPDFGPKKDATFEVKLVSVKLDSFVPLGDGKELYRYAYRLHAQGATAKGRQMALGVSGMVTLHMTVDVGASGVPLRSVADVQVTAFNQEL
jgi:hypothetical protein